eukprot:658390-Prorocentrum_lima.AAC.1
MMCKLRSARCCVHVTCILRWCQAEHVTPSVNNQICQPAVVICVVAAMPPRTATKRAADKPTQGCG